MKNATFKIDGEIGLDTIIGEITGDPGNGYDSPPEVSPYTLGDMLIERLVTEMMSELRGQKGGRFDAIQKQVTAEVSVQIEKAVTTWIAEAMKEPLQRTDEWGTPKGEPVALVDLVKSEAQNQLRAKRDGSYERNSVIGKAIEETTQRVLASELSKEIEAVKTNLRGKVRTSASEILAETITRSLGV